MLSVQLLLIQYAQKSAVSQRQDLFCFGHNCGEGSGNPLQYSCLKIPRTEEPGTVQWGRKELDTTEQLHFHFSLSCIGEDNGNPLQCSCLEEPRDRGAWCAVVYGVTESRTWLKWLSSSSSSNERSIRKLHLDILTLSPILSISIQSLSSLLFQDHGHHL